MVDATLEEATTNPQPSPPRQPGSAVGIVTYIADDFDAPLDDFDEGSEAEGLQTPR